MDAEKLKEKAEEELREMMTVIDVQDFKDFAIICFDYCSNRFESKTFDKDLERIKETSDENGMLNEAARCMGGKMSTLASMIMMRIAELVKCKDVGRLNELSTVLDSFKAIVTSSWRR